MSNKIARLPSVIAADRHLCSLTSLSSGHVLIAGGSKDDEILSSAEIYDPLTENREQTAPLIEARSGHTATLLRSGLVLVVGGFDGRDEVASAELYDPVRGYWQPTGSLRIGRSHHHALLLPSGNVLVTGGCLDEMLVTEAEVYDPASGCWRWLSRPQQEPSAANDAHDAPPQALVS